MLKVALVAVIMAVVSANPGEKLFSCCKKVSTAEIKEPIIKFEVQRSNPPCVTAVIFTTQTGHYCSHPQAPWVFQKIQELRRAKAQLSTPQVVSSVLLSIITSTAAPPSSSSPGPSSSSTSSSFSSSASTTAESETFSASTDQ
uniref:Chemokine interleukin-8-like domain-containing protein n=1 Tax=Poecilia formosa TaxID=48698 RepID=A0A096M1B0_POEFO